ncbi:S60 ribosomal protein L28 [Tieghemostelium lacteum]|uniref:S60 ribosomal protein L28 n=1 Tax=Tieghemostelium lacteum TaxID=361077 RepID=A0A152A5J4_TIELA|nr:S60 ribosomal protein L28 [Tieghemostelium lacteum]|eukprot:KYR01504.1 S60 ribosomal protein L28 [Tieghemostelium lacteum]
MSNNNNNTEKKALHPLSRKAKKLTNDTLRQVHKEKHKSIKNKESNHLKEKLDWFQSKLEDGKKIYTPREIAEMIEEYIERNQLDVELGQSKTRSNKVDYLKTFKESEIIAFKTSGYLAPDLTKSIVVQWLKNWDGDKKYLQQAQMKKFKSIDTLEKEELQKAAKELDNKPQKQQDTTTTTNTDTKMTNCCFQKYQNHTRKKMSTDLIWNVIKNNNAFRIQRAGVVFSSEPGNLRNKNSLKYSGLARKNVVGVELNNGKFVVSSKLVKKAGFPAASKKVQSFPTHSYKKTARYVRSLTTTYAPELRAAALGRLQRLKLANINAKYQKARNAKKTTEAQQK